MKPRGGLQNRRDRRKKGREGNAGYREGRSRQLNSSVLDLSTMLVTNFLIIVPIYNLAKQLSSGTVLTMEQEHG